MKYLRWQWFVPLLQLLIAFGAWVYEPYEYRLQATRDGISGDNNVLTYFYQHHPAPVLSVSWGINFPALVLAYPFRKYTNELFYYRNSYTHMSLTPWMVGFFVGVAVLWWWIGWRLDRMLGRNRVTPRSRWTTTAELMCGFLFGVLSAVYATQIVRQDWQLRPERPIAVGGMVWSLVLLAYSGWRAIHVLWRDQQKQEELHFNRPD